MQKPSTLLPVLMASTSPTRIAPLASTQESLERALTMAWLVIKATRQQHHTLFTPGSCLLFSANVVVRLVCRRVSCHQRGTGGDLPVRFSHLERLPPRRQVFYNTPLLQKQFRNISLITPVGQLIHAFFFLFLKTRLSQNYRHIYTH